MSRPVEAERGWSSAPEDRPDGGGERHQHRSFFSELPVLVVVAFLLALLLKTFVVQAFYIPSSSMEPTLLVGDRVLVNKLAFEVREPRRGEIVVFSEDADLPQPAPSENLVVRVFDSLVSGLGLTQSGERDFIKRIIGLPGEQLELRDGTVYINDQPIAEAPTDEGGYLSARDLADYGPVTVPDGHYFMMGDNRPNSADSRSSLGPIPADDVVGRAFVVIWPVTQLDTLPIAGYGTATAHVGG